MLRNKQKKLL